MSVSSIDTKIATDRRGIDTRLTTADVAMIGAWAALTVVLLGYATVEGTLGALVLGVLTMFQAWNAWRGAAERDDTALIRFE
jgi:hypothetical protein